MTAIVWKFLKPIIEPILLPLVAIIAGGLVFLVMHFWIVWFHDPAIEMAAREGYVVEAEKIALQAKFDQEHKYRMAAQNASIGYAQILTEVRDRQAIEQEQSEAKIHEYEQKLQADGGACYLRSDADVDGVRNAAP